MELCAEPATQYNGGDKSCLDPTNLKIRKIFRMSGKPHKASFARFPPGPSAADWFG